MKRVLIHLHAPTVQGARAWASYAEMLLASALMAPALSAHGGRTRRQRKAARAIGPDTPASQLPPEVLSATIDSALALPTRRLDVDETGPPGRPVTLVALSDTHGFEQSLGSALPAGDVLIHCGDFHPGPHWPGGENVGEEEAQRRFDGWLASQPHPIKIVVRGNHDPIRATFPLSGALYATSPQPLELALPNGATLRLALVPFFRTKSTRQRSRHKRFTLPLESLSSCDVLVSHVPPRGVLDSCYDGALGGCATLRTAVESSPHKPRLWLCGHIHESRGAVRHRFGGLPDATVVVNAASANSGVARKLLHGATVVTLNAGSSEVS